MPHSLQFRIHGSRIARLYGTLLRPAPTILLLSVIAAAPQSALAQPKDDEEFEDENIPLIERDYFDRITLDGRNRNQVYEIEQIKPPLNGKKPETGALRFRRIDAPSLLFEVPWKNVVKVETFPGMILDEAIRMRNVGELDAAFEYFAFLVNNYPTAPNLDAEINTLLYLDVKRLFNAKQYPETLAVLEELYSRASNYRPSDNGTPLGEYLRRTFDEMLKAYFEAENFASVRQLITRIQATYADEQKDIVDIWNDKLLTLANASRKTAEDHIAKSEGRQAHTAVRRMLDIFPTIQGGNELEAKVMNLFPLVMVGVSQQAFSQDPTRIDNWATKRAGHLTRRTLLEYVSRGEEGGKYSSPLGTFELSEDGSQVLLDLSRIEGGTEVPQASGYDISQRLISLADPSSPEFNSPWNRLVKNVRIEGINRVWVDLRFPHVLPEAFLRIPIESLAEGKLPPPDGIYISTQPANNEVIYDRNPRYSDSGKSKRPKIIELYFADADQAVTALKKGQIDVIDRVFPADLMRLENDPNIVVEPYELPTVHLLIPNPRSPYLKNINFRRALTFGINRQMILDSVLLANRRVEGCRTISGPFPAGVSDSDAFAYAYNERIIPLSYEHLLAIALTAVAEKELEVEAEKKKEKPPKRPELLLAYPVGDVPRIASEEIARHLAAIDIKCKAVPLPEGVTTDPDNKYDLLYVELSMWEPLVEARRLFKTDGLIRERTQHIELALSELEAARNWSQARRWLYELHRLSHYDAIAIPLWQILDHVAYRKGLTGIGENPLTLYQNAANWKISPRGSATNND